MMSKPPMPLPMYTPTRSAIESSTSSPCGLSREVGRRDREEDEPSHLPQVLLVDVIERIEVLDLARHLAGEIFGVEVSDASDAVEAFTKGLPSGLRPNSNWRNQPYCGYDNPSQTDSSLPAA